MKTFTLLEYYMHVAKTLQQNNTDTNCQRPTSKTEERMNTDVIMK